MATETLADYPGTGQVADELTDELDLKRPLTERFLNSVLRAWPSRERPPVIAGKRRWRPVDLERLKAYLEQTGRLSASA